MTGLRRCEARNETPATKTAVSWPGRRPLWGALPSAWVLLVMLVLAPSLLWSQTAAARLLGTVRDENGVAVPAAIVRVQDAAGRRVTTVTNRAGQFQFFRLAAGPAAITIEKHGYFRRQQAGLRLRAGLNRLQFQLPHVQEVQQQVEVVSSANPIEPESASRSETLVAQEIRDLPFSDSHDLKRALPALPSILSDNNGQLHVAGARADQAEVLLNGFEIGDPVSGGFTSRVDIDSVRAANVRSGVYGAQFAHGGAGVLDLTTVNGDDRFRFGSTNFLPGVSLHQGFHLGNWYPRFNLSGPIRKGRAWFADGLSIQHTFNLNTDLPRGANTQTTWLGDNLFSTQFNLTPRNSLFADFLLNASAQNNFGLSTISPLETTTNLSGHRAFVSLRDQITMGKDVLDLGGAFDGGNSRQTPKGNALYVIQPQSNSGNFFETLHQNSRRWQAIGDLLLPALPGWGSHDLDLGFNLDGLHLGQTATRNDYVVEDARGHLLQRASFSGSTAVGVAQRLAGVYVQDAWRIGSRLLILPGFRFDHDSLTQSAVAEPRIAVNVFPFGDDRAKLSAGWGIYAAPVNLGVYGQALDQERSDTFYSAAGVPVGPPVVTRFLLPANLQSPRFDTASLGWQQRVERHTYAGIYLLSRSEHDGLAYQPITPGILGGAFLLQNGRRDRYRAVDVSVRHSFEERAELFADYIRSKADTNQVLDYTLINPVFGLQAPGPLPWDAPNRFVSWGWTQTPFWRLLLSYSFDYRTGYPFNVVNQQQTLVGAPERMRFPNDYRLDLGFEKQFPFYRHLWAVRLAIINITGRNNPTAVVNNVDAPNFLTFSGSQGRAFTARLRLVGRRP